MSNIEKSKYLVELYNKFVEEKRKIESLIIDHNNVIDDFVYSEVVGFECSSLRVFSTETLHENTKSKIIYQINKTLFKDMDKYINLVIENEEKEVEKLESELNKINNKIIDLDENGFESETFINNYGTNNDFMI